MAEDRSIPIGLWIFAFLAVAMLIYFLRVVYFPSA